MACAPGRRRSFDGRARCALRRKGQPIDTTPLAAPRAALDEWLLRLGLNPHDSRTRPPDIELLRTIHTAHIQQVPFENLDIHLGRPIELTIEALQAKQVGQRRGGFCYELNGLLEHHLRTLGFDVALLSGHYRRNDTTFGPPFDHLALLVNLDDPWLVDVGSFLHPLLLAPGDTTQTDGGTYRLTHDTSTDEWTLFERRSDDDAFVPQFRFDLTPHVLADYVPMCHVHSTSPESHFTHGRLCSRATQTGRISLSESRLIVTDAGVRHETPITTNAEFEAALLATFAIELRGALWRSPLAPDTDTLTTD